MKNSMYPNEIEKSNRILYTPAPFAKSNLIYLQETGELKAGKNYISKRKNLRSFLFFIVINGKGKVKYKNQDYIVKPGHCVFLNCLNEYSYESLDDLWELKWVHFYSDNMIGIYEEFIQRGGKISFYTEAFIEYSKLIDDIYTIAVSDINIREMKLYEKFVSLLSLIMDECNKSESEESNKSITKDMAPVKKYIDDHYSENISLDILAGIFFINKFYLTRLFKKQYGVSIINYLIQVRITRAKQLLRFTDMSIENISSEIGFNDNNYFSRTFKNVEGISPREFRSRW